MPSLDIVGGLLQGCPTFRLDYWAGTCEGVVERIATTTDEHPHPPKVIFTNQRGKEVAHNPSTLQKKAAAEQHVEEGDE
jgi:hypothetical protein